MLSNINCELMVEVLMGKEGNVLTCGNNAFCLIVVNIIKITFVSLFYNFVRF